MSVQRLRIRVSTGGISTTFSRNNVMNLIHGPILVRYINKVHIYKNIAFLFPFFPPRLSFVLLLLLLLCLLNFTAPSPLTYLPSEG